MLLCSFDTPTSICNSVLALGFFLSLAPFLGLQQCAHPVFFLKCARLHFGCKLFRALPIHIG